MDIQINHTDLHKLLCAASGDAALLYLYIHSGNSPENAQNTLKLSDNRLACATATLRQLGLWPEKKTVHMGDNSNLSTKMLYIISILEENKGVEGEIFVNTDLSNKGAIFRKKI